jgi:hypothetical protein
MERHLADGLIGVSEEVADERAGIRVVGPSEDPDGIATEPERRVLQGVLAEQGDHRGPGTGMGHDSHDVPLHRRTRLAEERDEILVG